MKEESPQATKPLTWDEQDDLFPRLPHHLAVMALFAVNSGARDENVCGLRWAWEHRNRRIRGGGTNGIGTLF